MICGPPRRPSPLRNGVNFHVSSILAEAGLDDAAIPLLYTPLALASAAAALLAGPVIDALRAERRLLALARAAGDKGRPVHPA